MSIEHTKTLYTLTPTKQLVDINKDVSNFRCRFSIASKEGEPFEAVIVDQVQLDSGDEFPFQSSTNGMFGGELIMDKNIYQNFYLAMKAPKTTIVEVDLEFERLPEYIVQQNDGILLEHKRTDSGMLVKGLVVLAVVLIVGGVIYGMTRKEGENSVSPSTSVDITPKESLLSNLKQVPIE